MKLLSCLIVSAVLTTIAVTPALATPDPIFKGIIPTIRRIMPKDMVMRLPSHVPKVYKEARYGNSYGTQVYTNGFKCEDRDGGVCITWLGRTPDCNATSCSVGYISVARRKPKIRSSDTGNESTDREQPIKIKSGLSGYYFYARAGSAGHRHNLYWKQSNLWFHLNFRGFEKEEVRKMAASMAKELPIRSQG